MHRVSKFYVGLFMALLVAVTTAGSAAGGVSISPAAKSGGSLTVLEVNVAWSSLYTVNSTSTESNVPYYTAIYGQLFEQGPHGVAVPYMASGYSFSDHNLTVTINLKKGITFSDGTPFNAQAVAASISSDLSSTSVCACISDFNTVKSVVAVNPYEVQLHLSEPHAAIINAFVGEGPDYITDPTALASEGATQYAQHPVGAGPFTVTTNTPNSQLSLAKNPHFFIKGEPYLQTLTFDNVTSDQTAYNGIQSGQGEIAQNVSTTQIIDEAKSQFNVPIFPGVYVMDLELNTKVAPFNNIVARKAVYYATNSSLILKDVGLGLGTVTEGLVGPGSPYFKKNVPGYLGYNLAAAKAEVAKLGGSLSFTVDTSATTLDEDIVEALQDEWSAAGIHITPIFDTIPQLVAHFNSNNWNVDFGGVGNTDPSVGAHGVADRFGCGEEFTGYCSPALDGLMNKAAELTATSARLKYYTQLYEDVAKNALAPMIYASPTNLILNKSVQGYWTATKGYVDDWESLWLK